MSHLLVLENFETIPSEGVDLLLALVSKEEVLVALKSMKSYKAFGLDGFQPFFFKKYWNIIEDDVWNLVKSAFENESFDSKIS